MKTLATKVWRQGIVSTFLAGLFIILPVVITLAIIGWVVGKLREWFAPDTLVGKALADLGHAIGLSGQESTAIIVGSLLVLLAIWALGVLVKATARHKFDKILHDWAAKVPLVGSIYKPVSQIVGMLKGQDAQSMKAMTVVFAQFGQPQGAGFLGLLVSKQVFNFNNQASYLVYVPTSPVPMSGGLIFAPVSAVTKVAMSVDDLVKIYLSLGVISTQVIPQQYWATSEAQPMDENSVNKVYNQPQ
jgi:uncharacterized membrane protein